MTEVTRFLYFTLRAIVSAWVTLRWWLFPEAMARSFPARFAKLPPEMQRVLLAKHGRKS